MGYCIFTPVRSKALQDQMLAFLVQEFRHYDQIRADGFKPDIQGISDPGDAEALYMKNRPLVGFYYKSWWGGGDPFGFERTYYHVILNWVALQIGKKKTGFLKSDFGDVQGAHLYTVYDGCDAWPLFTKKPPLKRNLWRWVDRYGVCKSLDSLYSTHGGLLFSTHARTKTNWKKPIRDFIETQSWTLEEIFNDRDRAVATIRACLADVHEEYMAPIRAEMKRLDAAWSEARPA